MIKHFFFYPIFIIYSIISEIYVRVFGTEVMVDYIFPRDHLNIFSKKTELMGCRLE